MPDPYLILKTLHVLGATVLIGTGAGIAFFMLMAHRTNDPRTIAAVARIVVLADYVFTASAVVVQPITGVLLSKMTGVPILEGWVFYSIILYIFIGALWLPVVWIQTRMRDLAIEAANQDAPLPLEYGRLFRLWFALGIPAFTAIVGLLWIMIAKP